MTKQNDFRPNTSRFATAAAAAVLALGLGGLSRPAAAAPIATLVAAPHLAGPTQAVRWGYGPRFGFHGWRTYPAYHPYYRPYWRPYPYRPYVYYRPYPVYRPYW